MWAFYEDINLKYFKYSIIKFLFELWWHELWYENFITSYFRIEFSFEESLFKQSLNYLSPVQYVFINLTSMLKLCRILIYTTRWYNSQRPPQSRPNNGMLKNNLWDWNIVDLSGILNSHFEEGAKDVNNIWAFILAQKRKMAFETPFVLRDLSEPIRHNEGVF